MATAKTTKPKARSGRRTGALVARGRPGEADGPDRIVAEPKGQLRTADLPLWPGKNRYGVTDLLLEFQAAELPCPVVRWGEIYRGAGIPGGTHHFYVDDFQFSGLWSRPWKVGTSKCAVAVEPNYSIGPAAQTPRWKALQFIGQKRWLARYWQEQYGVRIIVDLNVHPDYRDISILGVPRGWRAYATRVHPDTPWEWVEDDWALACERAGTDDIFFAVFGGHWEAMQRCRDNGWVWHRSGRDWRRPQSTFVPPENERFAYRMPPKAPPESPSSDNCPLLSNALPADAAGETD